MLSDFFVCSDRNPPYPVRQQRREAEAAPAAEPFKLRQFKNVKSRFASAAAAAATAAPPGTSQVDAAGASSVSDCMYSYVCGPTSVSFAASSLVCQYKENESCSDAESEPVGAGRADEAKCEGVRSTRVRLSVPQLYGGVGLGSRGKGRCLFFSKLGTIPK